ncbi:L-rhamnose mutarotase [Tamlana sp. 2201CG12-4]|uniref:L-rhamnose mutarotase n=1 Tax=Tamlana sp. 2201CG12-4 TaxID=3112582 RepID=UPI002DBE3346|nr:L-rhamnose mutarotase [Tamlana sp. 2201CG12-4]MEC3907201.1 L-rhamnose mutarotase [Tamlana sp. 2201CG12-4]
MKKYVFIVLLIQLMVSCKEEKKTSEVIGSELITTETKYEKDQFRRFTFFVETEKSEVLKLFKTLNWGVLSKGEKDIYVSKAYQKDNGIFLVFDTNPNFNCDQLLNVLKVNEEFADLIGQLESKDIHLEDYNKPLERIFKMEQKKVYSPEEGQLKTKLGDHKRFVWTLLLQEDPEMIAEYKAIHGIGKSWPEVINNMKTIGVKDMELYLYGTRAMLIMDTRPDFDLAIEGPKWQKLPREMEWQEYVAKFQRIEPGSGIQEKWLDMVELN